MPCTIIAGVEYWRLFSVHESIDEGVATVTPAAVYKSVNDLGLQMIPKEIESLRLELSSNGDLLAKTDRKCQLISVKYLKL